METFFKVVVRWPKTVIFINLLITAFFISNLYLVRNETNIEEMLPKTVDAWFNKLEREEIFGIRDMVVIGVFNEGENGVFNPSSLALVKKITDHLKTVKGVNSQTKNDLVSLSTLDNIIGTDMGMEVRPFMSEPPDNQEEADKIRKEVFANNMFIGSIVSHDATGTVILAEPEIGSNHSEIYFTIKKYVDKLKSEGVKEEIIIAGPPVIEGVFGVLMPKEMQHNVPIVLALILLFLVFSFKSVRGVLLPVFIVISSVVWTMATMGLAGIPIYTISTMMPVILIAIGIADGIHLLNKYYDEILLKPEATKEEIVLATMNEMWVPVAMTTFTSMAGFLCNILSEMIPIRYFGIFTALGIFYAMVVTITFLPAMLMVLKIHVPKGVLKRVRAGQRISEASFSGRFLHKFAIMVNHQKRFVAFVTTAVIAICIYGVFTIVVDASLIGQFRESEPIRKAERILNEKFAGTSSLYIMIKAKEKDAFKAPELLRKIDNIQRELEKNPYIGDTLALAEFMKRMNMVMNENRSEMEVIPKTRDLAAQYLLLYSMSGDPSDFDDVVDYDYQYVNIRVSIKTDKTEPIQQIIKDSRRIVNENFHDNEATVKLSGTAYTVATFVDLIISGQIQSLILAIVAIFTMNTLMFRSFIGGFLSIIPIVLCTLFNYGMMGIIGFPLDIASALTGGMALGIGVDYAIHYLNKYKIIASTGEEPYEVSVSTLETAGKGIFLNAVVVVAGFLVLLNAELLPQVKLGILVSSTMLICFLASVTVLPLILNHFKPSFMYKKG
ncbi:MAG: MMPL family transporter [Nitrospinae bacterium]|nr:MMPL family transporter [Nitrospinota bacterium]